MLLSASGCHGMSCCGSSRLVVKFREPTLNGWNTPVYVIGYGLEF